jgi:hypothetical protein
MTMRYLTFAAVALLAACGGESGTNPPPPLVVAPRVARVQLASTSVLARTSSKFNATRLVQVAYDKNGAVINNPALWYVAPPGSYLRGDTVFTPASEGVGKLRISYDSLPGVPRGLLAASSAVSDTTAADTSLTVTVGLDLHPYRWRASWGCSYHGSAAPSNSAGVLIDSLYYYGAAQVLYSGDPLFITNTYATVNAYAQFAWQGSVVQFLRNGQVDTLPLTLDAQLPNIAYQAPDTLFLRSGSWTAINPVSGTSTWAAVRDTTAPLPRYVSRGWCYTGDVSQAGGGSVGSAVFEAY